ncbi:LamG-like jellyroll fold domain-containing protein [Saccharibacillus sp. CPCC 101409]|uniref:LamG-like jellyroll fold domain-containing protein n=1 Tax=Saccharibacillus sp. CPCC 101409 TaxID=3058041 RepID=UPI0026713A3D|nr:LamG-like jellyroll fold domain-containing protein [Saccharibacillus sp. CPCC 101409]MDO3411532.1 LamG-like jellyroll fold domain-containing protein [Saccharibacillus sp. CPCC 101409]
MKSKTLRASILLLLAILLLIPASACSVGGVREASAASTTEPPAFADVSVHDPSIVKDGGTYYVFGSHIAAAKSTDLMNWTSFANGYTTPGNTLYGDLSSNLAGSFAWAGENDSDSKGGFAVWAPDVFWNKDYVNKDGSKGAYLIYYSASSTYIRSAIGFAASKNIEGPYEYGDTIVYSGFTKNEAYDKDSRVNKKWTSTNIDELAGAGKLAGENESWFNADGSYNNQLYPNAIDAALSYDAKGRLWMTYGSWSGGIFLLEIDKKTGRPIFPGKDGTTKDGRLTDRYFGTKIAGGYGKSGEGPYIEYNKSTRYYYLYVTYGWLGADGGYNMRVFRSKDIGGPYKDSLGQSAVLPPNTENTEYGNKLIGNFLFDREPGDPGTGIGYGYVSPGHNSVYTDEKSGQMFLVFHTRFPQQGEAHELRVHQMFMNKDGWPAAAVYRYGGEKLATVKKGDIPGDYAYINHGKAYSGDIAHPESITLKADGTVSGALEGKWRKNGSNLAKLTLGGEEFDGVFVRQWDPVSQSNVMTFTAVSQSGESSWGTRLADLSDEQVVANVADSLDIGNTSRVTADLNLPAAGSRGAKITWSSSDESVVTSAGKVTRPAEGQPAGQAVLTATIVKGSAQKTVTFEVTVVPYENAKLTAHYGFENDLSDSEGSFAAGSVIGDRIGREGGNISYAAGAQGQAAVFDGATGVALPGDLIAGSSYSVSLWVKPEALTTYTPTFFGAKDDTHWVSLLPKGSVGDQTMVWSGSARWYDGVTGVKIPAGEWSHLAFSVDEGTLFVYVNGERKFTGADFPDLFAAGGKGTFALGVNWWDPAFKGQLDELRVYEGALTPEQAAELSLR